MPILLAVLFMLLPAMVYAGPVEPGPGAAASTSVKGDILYIEGQYLVVKEVSGRETRVHVNGETKLSGVAGRLKAGDKIEATITADGHATTVALQGLESSSPPGPR